MLTTGKIKGMTLDYESRKMALTILIDDKQTLFSNYDKLKDEELSIKIDKLRKKRSLNANAYMWVLCEALAVALSTGSESISMTKEEVYREHIKNVGVFRQVEIDEQAAATLSAVWSKQGIGWFSERVDNSRTEGFVMMNLYYGSSTYNTKQMARLIENIIQDCNTLGVDTKSDAEIKQLIDTWEREI